MMIITISFKRPNIIHTTLDLILDIFSSSSSSMRRKSNLERAQRLQFTLTTFFQFRKVRFNVNVVVQTPHIYKIYSKHEKMSPAFHNFLLFGFLSFAFPFFHFIKYRCSFWVKINSTHVVIQFSVLLLLLFAILYWTQEAHKLILNNMREI